MKNDIEMSINTFSSIVYYNVSQELFDALFTEEFLTQMETLNFSHFGIKDSFSNKQISHYLRTCFESKHILTKINTEVTKLPDEIAIQKSKKLEEILTKWTNRETAKYDAAVKALNKTLRHEEKK